MLMHECDTVSDLRESRSSDSALGRRMTSFRDRRSPHAQDLHVTAARIADHAFRYRTDYTVCESATPRRCLRTHWPMDALDDDTI